MARKSVLQLCLLNSSTVCGASTYIYVLLNNRLTESCRAGEEILIRIPIPTVTMVVLGLRL